MCVECYCEKCCYIKCTELLKRFVIVTYLNEVCAEAKFLIIFQLEEVRGQHASHILLEWAKIRPPAQNA